MVEFKVTDHVLVPQHEILSEDEKQKLLKTLNISEKQLPKILESDPVVKEIGAKVGDVIKITRDSPVAGKSIYYRIVIKK
ncbi:MAG: DNA-directed RNA polymerase subunit H [Candidatus Aenigmarchaeota archaeon]|nr:DNA-directed RNA polymerase subunit H [Candidatus Aenigmarchaeota archaeon]